MFYYTVSRNADDKAYKKACEQLEALEGVKKIREVYHKRSGFLTAYEKNGKYITVENDFISNTVKVTSEEDISNSIDFIVFLKK